MENGQKVKNGFISDFLMITQLRNGQFQTNKKTKIDICKTGLWYFMGVVSKDENV